MKRFIAVLLTIALLLSLTGCASKEEQDAAKAVSVQIEDLADVTLEDAAAVQKAQEANEALTGKAQNHVKNDSTLENAHIDLAEIVTKMIDEIGTVTLDSEKAINAALAGYNKLTDEGKALVKNYTALEVAVEEHRDIFFMELNNQTNTVLEINEALNDRDVVTVLSMIDEQLPISEKLAKSKYYVIEEDAVAIMKNVRNLMVEACYPNTHILSLDNLIKIDEVYNATADSNEGEQANIDDDTGRDFYSYIYNTKTQMDNAFQAYTEYLSNHFELVKKKTEPAKSQYSPVLESMYSSASAEYFYKDEQGQQFSVYLSYIDMGNYYGEVCTIYVFFAPEMGVRDSYVG